MGKEQEAYVLGELVSIIRSADTPKHNKTMAAEFIMQRFKVMPATPAARQRMQTAK